MVNTYAWLFLFPEKMRASGDSNMLYRKENNTKRISSLELLRIVLMLIIVTGHYVSQSEFIYNLNFLELYILKVIGSAARIAVNTFLILGCYFMVISDVTPRRIMRLYWNMWMITFPVTMFAFFAGYDVGYKNLLFSALPFMGNILWFASSYLCLMLLSPWLKKVLELRKNEMKHILVILFIVIPVWHTMHCAGSASYNWLECLGWFVFVYLSVGYYRFYVEEKINYDKWLVLFIGVVGYCLLFVISDIMHSHVTGRIAMRFLVDFRTIPNFGISAMVFYFFSRLNIGYCRFINDLAKGAFSVYIYHQVPAIIPIIWDKLWILFFVDKALPEYFMKYSVFTIVLTYIAGCLYYKVYVVFFENRILSSFVNYQMEKRLSLLCGMKMSHE